MVVVYAVAPELLECGELERRKDRLGLSWADVIRRGIKCLEQDRAERLDGD